MDHRGARSVRRLRGPALTFVCAGLLVLIALVLSASAQARTLVKRTTTGSTTLTVCAVPSSSLTCGDDGEEHEIAVDFDSSYGSNGSFVIDDDGLEHPDTDLIGGANCTYHSSASSDHQGEVTCPLGSPATSLIKIDGSAQDDDIFVDVDSVDTAIDAGGGDDSIEGGGARDSIDAGPGEDVADGGDGDDRIDGGSEDDILDGGPGNDVLTGGPGDDDLLGGQGSDVLSGGDSSDTADYSTSRQAVTVDLDGNGDDGASGEHDNVKPDVENVKGGSGDDWLTGNSAANILSGGDGNDLIRSRDAGADQVFCGKGTDTVLADSLDAVAADCESVSQARGLSGSSGDGSFRIDVGSCGVARHGTVACVVVRCVGAVGTCGGRVSLKSNVSGRGKPSGRRARSVALGASNFGAARSEARVRVRLSRSGRRLLVRKKRLRADVVVDAHDESGAEESDFETITLRAGRARRHGR